MLTALQNLPKNINCVQLNFFRFGVDCNLWQSRGGPVELTFINRQSYDEKGNKWNEIDNNFENGHFCFADMDTALCAKDGELTVLGYDDVTPEMRTLWDYMRDFWGRALDACLEGRITYRPDPQEGTGGDLVCGDREAGICLCDDVNHGVIIEDGKIRFKGRRYSERFIMERYAAFAYLLGDENHY